MTTLHKQTCPTCGQSVNERQIWLFKGMAEALFRVFRWCEEHNRHEFQRKDVKHLFGGENISARFGDWALFGGLVYKNGKGDYGLNIQRCSEFFDGRLQIPTLVTKNPLTREIRHHQYLFAREIPGLLKFLDENKRYISQYGEPNQPSLI